jgi:hypothetical protein
MLFIFNAKEFVFSREFQELFADFHLLLMVNVDKIFVIV